VYFIIWYHALICTGATSLGQACKSKSDVVIHNMK